MLFKKKKKNLTKIQNVFPSIKKENKSIYLYLEILGKDNTKKHKYQVQ